jgi:uncharacterized phage protein gp47/JayE
MIPQIDKRTASDVATNLRALIKTYAPEWKGAGTPGDFGDALVQIFARYAEIVIERLNRAPEKNMLAYLDMLGAALQPPQPARVPLAFSLAVGSTADAVVPARTQVAGAPAEGETAPVVFETERELVVVAATLDKIFVRDPRSDSFKDFSPSAPMAEDRRAFSAPIADGVQAFRGTTRLDHSLYIGLEDDLYGRSDLRELHFDFTMGPGPPPSDDRSVQWSIVGRADEAQITPKDDGTAGLKRTGRISFSDPPALPRQRVNGQPSHWLRCQLTTPIAWGNEAAVGRVRASQIPAMSGLRVSAVFKGQHVPLDHAFANAATLDATKDFLPFGERPRLGDALYLSAGDAFSLAGAQVTLTISFSDGNFAQGRPRLEWEYWDGGRWEKVLAFTDETAALTKSGKVTFTLGGHPAMIAVGGTDGYWIRLRIAGGHYGVDAKYEPIDPSDYAKGYKYTPPTLAPPSIASIMVDYIASIMVDYEVTVGDKGLLRVRTCNDFEYEILGTGQPLFRPTADQHPTLYFGFALLGDRRDFPNRPVSLFLGLDEPRVDTPPDNPKASKPARLVWECWVGGEWRRPGLRDDTRDLTHSGVLEFLAPAGFAPRCEFGVDKRYWLRCRWEAGDFAFAPRLRRIVLNAVMAEQASTILDETLGSSDGSQSQRFATARRPILHGGGELWVREPDLPAGKERDALSAATGDDAVAVVRDVARRTAEIWVRWQEVPDFYGSGPRDRHYVLDHMSGTAAFGDGANGLIPPVGAGNLRLRHYRTGGGGAGNRDAHTIAQLTTTIPYIASVTNPEPARGGADAETLDALLKRAPRAIRHGDRAVTIEDFEDLATLASPEVARAKCVPLYDLSVDPDAASERPGTVSVIIVPRSDEAKPLPSLALRERVVAYLEARCPPVVDLRVVAADYLKVDVKAEVALTTIDRASEVHSGIVAALRRFLHPLTGGFAGTGWDFGRSPQISDLVQVIGAIPGVDHIRSLTAQATSERGNDKSTARSLCYAGALDITVTAVAP